MPTSTITLAGQTVTLATLPANPAPKAIQPWIADSVALVVMPFTGQVQAQGSPGADSHGLTVTYAPLCQDEAAPLQAWLAQMRGMSRGVMMADPGYTGPRGQVNSRSAPVASTSGSNNAAMSTTLVTRGWLPSQYRLLRPWDAIQIGYRLHWVLDDVDSDPGGNASFEIFPSLRDPVPDGTQIVVNQPKGIYRLAQNRRNWSLNVDRFTDLSFQLLEYR